MTRISRSPLFDSSTLSFTFNGVRTVSNISLHTCMLGSTINSMNPICDSATKVLLRSHSGENGNPSAFSLSPWRKNSSNNCIVHLSRKEQQHYAFLSVRFKFFYEIMLNNYTTRKRGRDGIL